MHGVPIGRRFTCASGVTRSPSTKRSPTPEGDLENYLTGFLQAGLHQGNRSEPAAFSLNTAATTQLEDNPMSEAKTTTNHDEIRKWVEERDGRPSRVKTSGKGGVLRIDFREPEESFEEISWDDFFKIFDENNLAFLHQDKTADGKTSRFNKFVERSK